MDKENLESVETNNNNNNNTPLTAKAKRRKVAKACTNCKSRKLACNEQRPCDRCVKRGEVCRDNVQGVAEGQGVSEGNCKDFDSAMQSHSVASSVDDASIAMGAGFMQDSSFDFFSMFQQSHQLPMDEPVDVFQFLSLQAQPKQQSSSAAISATMSASNIPVSVSSLAPKSTTVSSAASTNPPTCFSGITDIEDLFPSNPFFSSSDTTVLNNVCKSRGLPACNSCSFNIENIMPEPYTQAQQPLQPPQNQKLEMSPLQPLHHPPQSQKLNMSPLDYYTSSNHLSSLFAGKGFDASISAYLESCCQKILIYNIKESCSLLEESHNNLTETALTPCCIISPTGVVKNANLSFLKLVSNTNTCLFAYLDLASILSLFDMINSFQTLQTPVFGRLALDGKSCGVSLEMRGEIWILISFIPI